MNLKGSEGEFMQILECFRQMVLDGQCKGPAAFKDSKEVNVAAAECMRGEKSERDGGVLGHRASWEW